MNSTEYWRDFWQEQDKPLHRSEDLSHDKRYASELRILFSELVALDSVLELGCGNGALFPWLGFDRCKRYRGIDLSEAMLEAFRKKHGASLDLEVGDACTYFSDDKWDLIFSNGVIQYFDYSMLDKHLKNARAMMHSKSLLVHASGLWKAMRYRYRTGQLDGTGQWDNIARSAKRLVAPLVRKDTIGNWHKLKEIAKLGESNGMKAQFYGSLNYMYRFHVVFRLV